MLLVIDVGNTNITLGVYKEEKLEAKFRMTTKLPRTSDEYGISLCDLIEHQGFEIRQSSLLLSCRILCTL
jgi:type III pantothenate kinase